MIACNINSKMSTPKAKCQGTAMVLEENWYPVPGYPRYQVSTHGRMKRIEYTDNLGRTYKEIYIKGRYSNRIGARIVMCNGSCRDFILARVVATTLYGIHIDTKLTVNHIDGNRANNNIGNLELVSREENTRHGHKSGLYARKYCVTVLKDTKTGRRYVFDSQTKASQFMGKNKSFIANAKRDDRRDYGRYFLEAQNG